MTVGTRLLALPLSILLASAAALGAETVTDYEMLLPSVATYADEELAITYDETNIEILSATIETGVGENIAILEPGVSLRYAINQATGVKSVNIFGFYKDLSTQEIREFFTRVWDPECRFRIAPDPEHDCDPWALFATCDSSADADCEDGTTRNVSCSGDSDCTSTSKDGVGGFAKCTTVILKETTDAQGATVTDRITRTKTSKCSDPPPEEE